MNQSWVKFLPRFIRARIEGRAYLQNVVVNTGWQFADSFVRMGVGLVVGVWVARYLGPDQFGLLSYALAFVLIFSTLATLGLEDLVVREIVREPAAKDEILGTAFMMRLLGGSVAFLAAVGTIIVLHPADVLSHWLVGIIAAGSIFQAFNVVDFWFYSQVSAKYPVVAKNFAFLFCSIIKIILILFAAPLIAFAWVSLLEVAIGAFGVVIAYWSRGNRLARWRYNLGRAKGLLRDCWPLIFAGIVAPIYMRIDQVMLGEMSGSGEVGIYSVAVRMAEFWSFIPLAVYWSVFPAILESKEQDEELFYGRLQMFYNSMALAAYGVAIPVTVFGNWLVGALYGEAYARGGMMLTVLIWSIVFTNLEVARSSFLVAMNWNKTLFLTVLLGAVLNIVLNYFLIPRYGGMGAVVASIVSYWFAAHGSCFLFKPLRRTGMMITRAIFYPKIW
jgi:O-antigen/teichoic acid export membrane protein